MASTSPSGDIQATIQGRNYGQIAVGNNITQLTLNVDHGGVVHMHQPVTPVTEARPHPVDLRPRPVRELSAWRAVANQAVAALEQGRTVELWGNDPCGKTMLLRFLAHHPVAARFAAGVVYMDAASLTTEDLLQSLYEAFFQTRPPTRFGSTEIRSALQHQEALLLLDNADRGGLGVLKFLSRATFVLAHAQPLLGREDGVSIPLADTPPVAPTLLGRADAASPNARHLLGILAVLGARVVAATHLGALTQGVLAEVVAELEAAGLVVPVGDDAFALSPGLADLLAPHWDLGPFRAAAIAHFADWIAAHREQPDAVLPLVPLLLSLMEAAATAAQWLDALRLGRALEPAVALAGRWDAWEQVLECLLQAAGAVDDQPTVAYALHQLGIRAMCLKQEGARVFLERALAIRQELDDRIGMEVTTLNLAQVAGSLVSSTVEGPAPVGPSGSALRPGLRWRWFAITLVALGLGGALVAGSMLMRRGPAEPNVGRPPVTRPGSGQTTGPGSGQTTLPESGQTAGSGPGTPAGSGLQGVASVQPEAVDFGEVAYDVDTAAPQRQIVTLTNTGTAPLPLAAPAITGQNAGEFAILRTTCRMASLAPAASCTVDLTFRPTASGERTASLTFGSQAVPLRGVGIHPVAGVQPDSLLFTSFTSRAGAQEQTVTITNTGTGHLIIRSLQIEGASAAAFAVTRETCTASPLDPGTACAITVRFTPSGKSPYQAQLRLQHNGAGPTGVGLLGR